MHDPMTVAFEIKSPFKRKPCKLWPNGYRETLITIWHVDPEKDGSDDSCAWNFPNPSDDLIKKLADDLLFETRDDKDAIVKQRDREGFPMWWLLWMTRASFHHRGRGLSPKETQKVLYGLSYPGNRESFTNIESDMQRLAWIFGRAYLDEIRPWWRHPRWHIWHWKVQIHPIQAFKRWAFSRCCKCGKRFAWGYAPVSGNWHGTGPRWFRGEESIYHSDCAYPSDEAKVCKTA